MERIRKYPRTRHLEGSSLQTGDGDDRISFSELRGLHVVYEEKIDGANSGVFFDEGGTPHGQSRGHELDLSQRGGRERHFNQFKDWIIAHQDGLLERLEDRYTMYGEWTHAAHSVFYDLLPHHFHEFDVLDRATGAFLSTERRRELLDGLPVVSVPVLYEGPATTLAHLRSMIGPSLYKSAGWRDTLAAEIARQGLDFDRTAGKVEDSDLAEGVYGKVEEAGEVVMRFKYVRPGFVQKVLDVNEHWHSRPIVPNGLAPGVDMFAVPGPKPH